MGLTLHTGYSISRHGYRAVAFLLCPDGLSTVRCTGLGDTAAEALAEAETYVFDTYRREDLPRPDVSKTVAHGRLKGAFIDHVFGFGRVGHVR